MEKEVGTEIDISPKILRAMQISIDGAKDLPGWKPVKSIYIKAIARHETMACFAVSCAKCEAIREDVIQACKVANVSAADVTTLLAFKLQGQVAKPVFDLDMHQVENAILQCEMYGQDRRKFIFGCINFGMFKLESRLVIARHAAKKNPFLLVSQMVKDPFLQVNEFSQQWHDAEKEVGVEFSNIATFWRTGKRHREPFDYGVNALNALNSLRVQGHGWN